MGINRGKTETELPELSVDVGDAGLIYVDSSNRVGIGVSDPAAELEVMATTTQLMLSYDSDSFTTVTVADASHTTIATGESGNLIFDAAGDIELNADGADIVFKDGSATIGKFSSTSVLGMTVGAGVAEDIMIAFDGNAQDFRIGIDDGTDTLEIGHGTTHGTNTAITIDSSGQVTKFNIPAAAVAQASDHIIFLDGGATGAPKAESIDDFLTAIAGSGISVSSSQLTASGGASALNDLSDASFSSGDLTITALDTLTTSASAHNAAGTSVLIAAGDTTAGTTNNIAGGALTIAAGRGKGSGAGGDIIFQTANAGSSGSSLNDLSTALTISDDLSSTFAGIVDITDTTQATSNDGDNGALRCEGGASIAKKLFVGSDTDVAGTLSVAQYVSHTGDTNTRINFTPDAIYFEAGGLELLHLVESTQDAVTINDGGGDVDFRVETSGETHMLFIEGSSNRISIGDSTDAVAATLEITNANDAGAPLLQLNSNDTDQIGIDINAANIDADVIDITADAVTTAHVIDVSADALTTGSILNLASDSSSTGTRALVNITNDHASSTGTSLMLLKNDAAGGGGIIVESTAAETKPLLELINSNASTDKPPILGFTKINGAADDYEIGKITFTGENSAGTPEPIEYVSIVATASDITDGDEGGQLSIFAFGGGTGGTASSIEALRIGQERVAGSAQAFQAVFLNPSSGDCDVVMHGDGTSNMFRLNAGDDRIGIGAFPDEASAILEIETTTKGFLPPRMNTTQQNAISSPANGLILYNTTTNKLMVYNGSWTALH